MISYPTERSDHFSTQEEPKSIQVSKSLVFSAKSTASTRPICFARKWQPITCAWHGRLCSGSAPCNVRPGHMGCHRGIGVRRSHPPSVDSSKGIGVLQRPDRTPTPTVVKRLTLSATEPSSKKDRMWQIDLRKGDTENNQYYQYLRRSV